MAAITEKMPIDTGTKTQELEMAEVTASAVKSLREKSGAGMIDCKNALVEANGDENEAMELLRKKGMATAGKKAGQRYR